MLPCETPHLVVFRQERTEVGGQIGMLGQEFFAVGALAHLDVLQIRGENELQSLIA